MAIYPNWSNADGLVVKNHGTYETKNNFKVNRLRALNHTGQIRQYVMDVDLVKAGASATAYPFDLTNDGTNDGFTTEEDSLPLGSAVISAYFVTTVVAAGGTAFRVGTYQVDGTAIDDDSIFTETEAVLANMDHVGDKFAGAGVFCATTAGTSGPDQTSYVALKTNGTFTAGKGTMLINVLMPNYFA